MLNARADVSLAYDGVRELVHVKKDRSAMILGGGCELLNDVGTFELVDLCEAVGAGTLLLCTCYVQ